MLPEHAGLEGKPGIEKIAVTYPGGGKGVGEKEFGIAST